MINPLKVASDGYLGVAKRCLTIAVAGYLSFGSPEPPDIPSTGGGGKTGVSQVDVRRQRILQDDQEIVMILKAFVEIS